MQWKNALEREQRKKKSAPKERHTKKLKDNGKRVRLINDMQWNELMATVAHFTKRNGTPSFLNGKLFGCTGFRMNYKCIGWFISWHLFEIRELLCNIKHKRYDFWWAIKGLILSLMKLRANWRTTKKNKPNLCGDRVFKWRTFPWKLIKNNVYDLVKKKEMNFQSIDCFTAKRYCC